MLVGEVGGARQPELDEVLVEGVLVTPVVVRVQVNVGKGAAVGVLEAFGVLAEALDSEPLVAVIGDAICGAREELGRSSTAAGICSGTLSARRNESGSRRRGTSATNYLPSRGLASRGAPVHSLAHYNTRGKGREEEAKKLVRQNRVDMGGVRRSARDRHSFGRCAASAVGLQLLGK